MKLEASCAGNVGIELVELGGRDVVQAGADGQLAGQVADIGPLHQDAARKLMLDAERILLRVGQRPVVILGGDALPQEAGSPLAGADGRRVERPGLSIPAPANERILKEAGES